MTTIKHSAKPTATSDSELLKAALARIASLEAEAAVKATKVAKPSKRAESPFSIEDVTSMTAADWTELKDEFYVRQANGDFVPTITKAGGTRVTMKKGLDYGVYRFIKGIAVQMNRNSFEELSEKQVAAGRNILGYCLEHDLVESPKGAEVVKAKVGRPSKKAAATA